MTIPNPISQTRKPYLWKQSAYADRSPENLTAEVCPMGRNLTAHLSDSRPSGGDVGAAREARAGARGTLALECLA